jgi:hypothetical protein
VESFCSFGALEAVSFFKEVQSLLGGIMAEGNFPRKFQGFRNSYRSISNREDWFFNGWSFSYVNRLQFAADETKDFVFNPLACDCKTLLFNVIKFSANAGPILIDFFSDVTSADDGDDLLILNRLASSEIEPKSVFQLNPTVSDWGFNFSNDLSAGNFYEFKDNNSVTIGVKESGASDPAEDLPFEVLKSIKTGFRVKNENGAGTYVKIDMTFFEIPLTG